MSDQQLLDLFDSVAHELDREAELVIPPTSPAAVRSTASSRRRRRGIVALVVLVVLSLIVGGAMYASATSRHAAPNWAATSQSAPTSAPSEVAVTLAVPIDVRTEEDLLGVAWLSTAARTFLASELQRVRTAAGCGDEHLRLTAYRGTDLISGETAGCDAARVTWGFVSGLWKLVAGGQAVPTCFEVQSSGWASSIPDGFYGAQCFDDAGRVVAFTPGKAVQPVVRSGDVVTMLGIGELTIGMSRTDLVARGVLAPTGGCDVANPTPSLAAEGISINSANDTVDFIVVHSAQHGTQSGAKVGMTMGQVKQIYGDKVSAKTVTLQIGDPQGNTRQAYVISSGNTLVFMSESRGSIAASDIVVSIYLLRGSSLSVPVEIC